MGESHVSNLIETEDTLSLEERVDQAFARFAEETYASLRETGMGQAWLEPVLETRRELYESLDFPGKVSALTNNFHHWFPTGKQWYRNRVGGEGSAMENPPFPTEEVPALKAMLSAMDRILSSRGYTRETIEQVFDRAEESEADRWRRAEIIGEVYLALLEAGFERRLLVR